MDVIYITVPVVVDSVACDLLCVHPHVCLEVRMAVLHAFVNDCNDDLRVACDDLPYILDIDVCSCIC